MEIFLICMFVYMIISTLINISKFKNIQNKLEDIENKIKKLNKDYGE